MKQPYEAGADYSAQARNATNKDTSQKTDGGKGGNVGQPYVAGKDDSGKARKKTSKDKSQKVDKGTSKRVGQPYVAGKDYSDKARKMTEMKQPYAAGKTDDKNIDKSVDSAKKKKDDKIDKKELKEQNTAGSLYKDMKSRDLSDEDMLDVMFSMAKSKSNKDRKTAEALASILSKNGINESLFESALVKRVSATGGVKRMKNRKTRQRLATQTTGISKARRQQIAKKAARTKKANPKSTRLGVRKRKKAMRRRGQMGL